MTQAQSSTSTAAPKSRRTLVIVLIIVGVLVVAGLVVVALKVTGDSSDTKVVPAGQSAKGLFKAWEGGDQAAAAKFASAAAVTQMFAIQASEATGLEFGGCSQTGDGAYPKECIWTRPGGELTMTVQKQGEKPTVTKVDLGPAGTTPTSG